MHHDYAAKLLAVKLENKGLEEEIVWYKKQLYESYDERDKALNTLDDYAVLVTNLREMGEKLQARVEEWQKRHSNLLSAHEELLTTTQILRLSNGN